MTRKLLFLLCVFLVGGCIEELPVEPEKSPGLMCYFIQPYPMQSFPNGQDIGVKIEATAISGEVTEVSLHINDSLFETKTTPPYTFTIPADYLETGIHQMEAIALHSKEIKVSTPLSFSVGIDSPVVLTFAPENITHNQVFCSGEVLSEMGTPVTERGFYWSTRKDFLIDDHKKLAGSGRGIFNSYIDGLTPQTTYYVMAYAINSVGTGYGQLQVFTTTNPLAVVKIQGDTAVALTTCQWEAQAEVLSEGAAPVIERGFCWNTQPRPTPTTSKKLVVGSGVGSFTGQLSNLYAVQTYYVRAYATNMYGTAYGQEIRVTRSNAVSVPLIPTVAIPAGTFTMGSPSSECERDLDEAQHQVTLSAFEMSIYEITYELFDAYCEATCKSLHPDSWGRGKQPVINILWQEAVDFCKWYSDITGQYWRLPTEAEWEYACRAGTTTPFYTGTCINHTHGNIAHHVSSSCTEYYACDNSSYICPEKTVEVGKSLPNPWGLYDMQGNTMEWCMDWYGEAYPLQSQTNPQGPRNGIERVFRGGYYGYNGYRKEFYRSANRGSLLVNNKLASIGFRVVRVY